MRQLPTSYFVIHQDFEALGFEAIVDEHTTDRVTVVKHLADGQWPSVDRVDFVDLRAGKVSDVSRAVLSEARTLLASRRDHDFPEHLADFDLAIFTREQAEARGAAA
ncbi:hypothetical protein [uncultured Maricaulis sp.]|uniref:hypothetical protein n=1 Tax=uncultured Maricaulis sp. TaxID=174710 RepID=UPI0030DCC7AF